MLHVSGNQILYSNDQPFQIKGVSLIDIGEIGNIREKINTAMEFFWNMNTIRLPVYPVSVQGRISPYGYRKGNGLIEKVLVPAVAYAEAHNLQVIVDWHQINPLSTETVEGALEFWEDAVPQLSEWSNVIFEVYNEPTNGNALPIWSSEVEDSWGICKPFLQTLVSGVRDITEQLIICPTPVYCRLPIGADKDPLPIDNVAYAAHVYPPDVWDQEGFSFGYLQEHVDFSNAVLDQIRSMTNVPLVLTEVGLNNEECVFSDAFEKLTKDVQLNWVAWVLDDKWWPPMLTEHEVPSTFGKLVKKLMV